MSFNDLSDSVDDASTDHHDLERRLVAEDRDAARVSTAGIDETIARRRVIDLVENGVVSTGR